MVGVAALILGLMLWFAPAVVWRFCAALDHWGSPDAAIHWLNTPRVVERLLYRHHRLFGAALVLGSVYTLYIQAFGPRPAALSAAIGGLSAEVLVDAGSLLLFFGNLAAFAVGTLVFLRPSLLKGAESWANRWLAMENLTRFLERPYWETDRLLRRHPRSAGTALVMAGLYIVGLSFWHGDLLTG